MQLLGSDDFSAYRFFPASGQTVTTGRPDVQAALWARPGQAIVYLANFSPNAVSGRLRFDSKILAGKSGRAALAGEIRHASATTEPVISTPASLADQGISYALQPWASAALHLKGQDL